MDLDRHQTNGDDREHSYLKTKLKLQNQLYSISVPK